MRARGTSKTRFVLELTRTLSARQETGGTSALVIDEAQCLSRRAAGGDPPAREHRDGDRQAAAGGPRRPAGARRPPERAVAPAAEAARRAALCRCRPLDTGRNGGLHLGPHLAWPAARAISSSPRGRSRRFYEYSQGIPRTISVICDNALLSSFAADERPVSRDTVLEVCRDFDLHPATPATVLSSAAAAAPPPVFFLLTGSLDEPSRSCTAPRERAERSARRPGARSGKPERMTRALAALADIPSEATTSSANRADRRVLRREARRHRAPGAVHDRAVPQARGDAPPRAGREGAQGGDGVERGVGRRQDADVDETSR